MKRAKQQSVLHRRRVHTLSPQLHQLATLLHDGPKTIEELAQQLTFREDTQSDRIALVRACLSKLGTLVSITVNFEYGASTYEILQEKPPQTS